MKCKKHKCNNAPDKEPKGPKRTIKKDKNDDAPKPKVKVKKSGLYKAPVKPLKKKSKY